MEHHTVQGATAVPFYDKGDVRIRYEEAGSGFPLLVTPGGGLHSRVSNWPTAVINAMETFTNDFRCITMDQRNANGGESSGPVPVDDPWGAFADDQLGLMDHLGIREFCCMGLCPRRGKGRDITPLGSCQLQTGVRLGRGAGEPLLAALPGHAGHSTAPAGQG
jgi:hypothetical protein